MDIIITLGLVYLAFRAYQWYQRVQGEARGDGRLREMREEDLTAPPPPPGSDEDYIDYEEVKSEETNRREG